MDIKDRLIVIRGAATQEDFSKIVGIHKNTWARYERGERPPGARALSKLRALGFNPNWVLFGEGAKLLSENKASAHDLRLAHGGDQVAEERVQYRVHAAGQSVRESRLTLERVEQLVGYRPPEQWRELLKTLFFAHGLDESGAERIVDLLKNEHEQRGG